MKENRNNISQQYLKYDLKRYDEARLYNLMGLVILNKFN
jgi:hypothetical protein